MSEGHDEELIDREIAQQLKIPKLRIPKVWEGGLSEKEVEQTPKELRPVMLHIDVLNQKLDCVMENQVEDRGYLRYLEARMIQRDSVKWKLARWAGTTVGAAALGTVGLAIAKWIFERL